MIIKECLICEVTYRAKNNKTKTCSTICGNISATKTRQIEYDKNKPDITMAQLNKSKMTNRVRDYRNDLFPGIEISRKLWNKNLKLGEYK